MNIFKVFFFNKYKITFILLFCEFLFFMLTLYFKQLTFLDFSFISILIISFLYSDINNNVDQTFNKDTTATLRGVAMLGIIIHHIHNRCHFHSPILSSEGYLATALFFFISGYGNQYSISNKKNKINLSWLWNKCLKIYIPFFCCYLAYYIMLYFMYIDKLPNLKETAVDLLTISLPNQISWFPKIILLCFLIHYLSLLISRNKNKQLFFIACAIITYICLTVYYGFADYWNNSVIAYSLGFYFANKKNEILRILKKSLNLKYFIFCLLCLLFICFYIITFKIHYIKFLCSVLISIIVFILSDILSFKTKILSWIGNNSLEFYFFHCLSLQTFCYMISENMILYTASVILSSIAFVFLYIFFKQKIVV